jgi:hypothetical protein
VDPVDDVADLLHQLRRQAERGLVEQQQLRGGHQRPSDGQHLLLPAGQQATALVAALGEDREELEDPLGGRPAGARVADGETARAQVLRHGQVPEDAPALRDLHQAGAHHPGGVASGEVLVGEADAPGGDRAAHGAQRPRDGPQQRGLAGAVAAQDGDDRSRIDAQGDPAQRVHGAVVVDRQVVDHQEGIRHGAPSSRELLQSGRSHRRGSTRRTRGARHRDRRSDRDRRQQCV